MPQQRTKWRPLYYAKAYAYAAEGMSNKDIASALGVNETTFVRWTKTKPDLPATLRLARQGTKRNDVPSFQDYVYKQLSPHLQACWDRLRTLEREPNGKERVESMLQQGGTRLRQHMFIHALVTGLWSPTNALKRTNTSKTELDRWTKEDPDFAKLMDEIHWHKQNWYISQFDMRVAAGDTTAVLHAVKTIAADRGYNDRLTVEHTGTVEHQHNQQLDLTELDLPPQVQRQILDAIKQRQQLLGTNT